MKEWVCFVDVDGVLTDFIGGSLKVHNKNIPLSECTWDFFKQLGLSDSEFWNPLGYDFWANLSWTSEGKELLKGLESTFGDKIALMTSPCNTEGCVEGKIAWIKRELPNYSRRFFVGPPKHLAAGPYKILVDDHDANIDAFIKCGGRAVLVPRPWNKLKERTSSEGNFDIADVLGRTRMMLDRRNY